MWGNRSIRRTVVGLLGFIIGISLLIHVAGFTLGNTVFQDWQFVHDPLHAALEITGAVIAFGVTRLLITLEQRKEGTSFNIRIAAALTAMGVLDGLHALFHAGNTFVWLHSCASLFGGALFACVWAPQGWIRRSIRWWLITIAGIAVLLGFVSISKPNWIPLMLRDGRFTFTADAMNVAGGVLMFAAAARLLLAYRQTRRVDDLLFCLNCALFGAATAVFEQSSPWDFAWWACHVLRLLAYGVSLCFLIVAEERALLRVIHGIREQGETRYRRLFESSPDAIIIIKQGRIVDCNKRALTLFGYATKERLCQRDPAELSPAAQPGGRKSYDLADEHVRRAQRTGSDLFEWIHQRHDGTLFPADVLLNSIPNEDGEVLQATIRDITQRKSIEREHWKCLQTTRAIVESTVDGIVMIDDHGLIASVNTSALRIFGYPADELVGQNVSLLLPSPHREHHDSYIAEYLRLETRSVIGMRREFPARRKDGTQFPIELTVTEILAEGQRFFLGVVRDLTESRRAERRSRLMRAAIESANEAMYTIGADGRILDVNETACRRLKYTREELLSLYVWDINTRCSREDWPALWNEVKQKRRLTGESRHRARNGRVFPVEVAKSYIAFEDSEYVCDFVRDISERKSAQKALRESEKRFRELAGHIQDLLWMSSTDGNKIIYVSQAYESIWGRSCQSLYQNDQSWVDGLHPEDRDRVVKVFFDGAAETGFDETFRVVRPDGSVRWVNATGFPIRDEAGTVYRIGGVTRDITDQKQHEDALREARGAAQRANEAKSQFLAHMSHEIRTPLNSILGFTEVLRRGVGSDEQRTQHLQTIHASGRHLLALIDDILDLSKIEAGQMEFERVRCSPHQIISDVLSLLRVRALEKCLTLNARWSSGVPETILTDPARFRQLLMNVVGNAVKFTEHGGVFLTITVAPDAPEPRFVIEVKDTGIGIPLDRLESIFSPFTQADNSITRRFGGSGLGMAISRHIAQGLGGDIVVESESGKGSVFRITLETGPLDGVPIHDAPPSEAVRTRTDSARTRVRELPHATILVVEDGDTNRELIELLLKDARTDVVCAENGKRALEAVERMQFDLILMDLQMPVMDGRTAARQLRQDGFTGPIIALTAHAMRGVREECLASGFSGYLSKPIDVDELLATVADALREPDNNHPASVGNSTDDAVPLPAPETLTPIPSTLVTGRPECRPIVEKFVAKLTHRLEELEAAIETEDLETVRELAHWLKGSGGTMGFDCFTEPARRVEQMATHQQFESLKAGIQELQGLARRITVAPWT